MVQLGRPSCCTVGLVAAQPWTPGGEGPLPRAWSWTHRDGRGLWVMGEGGEGLPAPVLGQKLLAGSREPYLIRGLQPALSALTWDLAAPGGPSLADWARPACPLGSVFRPLQALHDLGALTQVIEVLGLRPRVPELTQELTPPAAWGLPWPSPWGLPRPSPGAGWTQAGEPAWVLATPTPVPVRAAISAPAPRCVCRRVLWCTQAGLAGAGAWGPDRKSTRLNSSH